MATAVKATAVNTTRAVRVKKYVREFPSRTNYNCHALSNTSGNGLEENVYKLMDFLLDKYPEDMLMPCSLGTPEEPLKKPMLPHKDGVSNWRKGQDKFINVIKSDGDYENITDHTRCFKEGDTKLDIDLKTVTRTGTSGIIIVSPSTNKVRMYKSSTAPKVPEPRAVSRGIQGEGPSDNTAMMLNMLSQERNLGGEKYYSLWLKLGQTSEKQEAVGRGSSAVAGMRICKLQAGRELNAEGTVSRQKRGRVEDVMVDKGSGSSCVCQEFSHDRLERRPMMFEVGVFLPLSHWQVCSPVSSPVTVYTTSHTQAGKSGACDCLYQA
ncbi:hypothetical protein COCSUDRAFT_45671 [Coccomyxa subellipsoidea C-169]|uniref:Uncharacterized protein n=1 Tax=Coccomyxa subellipsoidea (strain C-169) TaxID=574566 RepID=I0YI23_COCSC|nr:hypothetical protein COCSUDRAFT_45671 [Coccomyxa subellipsoidea C-169]EIE18042.1 hypothetical protein COCSUDRAFT_45671 [Coccomyxa subellipsoidea C-169]|eukprot:XP_005642586.1 hypothetical protein COCSUDRAFT_45671 [Coccomyxa subellipsoidea C-169]